MHDTVNTVHAGQRTQARQRGQAAAPVEVEGTRTRAPQMRLDLDLAAQLVLDVRLAQLALVQHFERDDEVGLLLARQVHLAKLAIAQRLANVKVVERPLAKRFGSSDLSRIASDCTFPWD